MLDGIYNHSTTTEVLLIPTPPSNGHDDGKFESSLLCLKHIINFVF